MLGVQILVMAPEIYVRGCDRMCQLIIYCSRHIVDLVVLLFYYSDCVDRSGSLSGGAFNQLRLATLNIVLTILYLLKTVLQGTLLKCLNSLYPHSTVLNQLTLYPLANLVPFAGNTSTSPLLWRASSYPQFTFQFPTGHTQSHTSSYTEALLT